MARKVSVERLLKTPKPMLAWLESKSPRAIVTNSVWDIDGCLGHNFLTAAGVPKGSIFAFGGTVVYMTDAPGVDIPEWFQGVVEALPGTPITAARAISAINSVTKKD